MVEDNLNIVVSGLVIQENIDFWYTIVRLVETIIILAQG